jgi:hypothetical protein
MTSKPDTQQAHFVPGRRMAARTSPSRVLYPEVEDKFTGGRGGCLVRVAWMSRVP